MCENNKSGVVSKSRHILKILNGKYKYSRKNILKKDTSIESRKSRTRCANESNCFNQEERRSFQTSEDYLNRKEDICQSGGEKMNNEFDKGSKNLNCKEMRNRAREEGYITGLSNKDKMRLSSLDHREMLGPCRRFKFTEQSEYLEAKCRDVAVKSTKRLDISPEIKDVKNFDNIPSVNLLQHYKKESNKYLCDLDAQVSDNCMAPGNICQCYNRSETVGLIDSILNSERNSAPEYTKKSDEFYGAKRGAKRMVFPRLSLADNYYRLIKDVNPQSQKTPDSFKQFEVQNHFEGIARIEKSDTIQSFGNNIMDYYQNLQPKNIDRMQEYQHTILKAKKQRQRIYSTDFYQIEKKRATRVDSIHTFGDHKHLVAASRPPILGQTSLATCKTEHSARNRLEAISADCIDKYVSVFPDLDYEGVFSGRDLWGKDVEKAFLEAISLYPLSGNKRIKKDKDSPLRGRNDLISEYIYERTSKRRTNKQISSHIQVLKRRHPGIKYK